MRLTGALPVWLIAEAIRKRRSDFNAVLSLVLVSLLDRLSGIEVSKCQLLGPAQARGGLPFVMSQLAIEHASCLMTSADHAVVSALLSGSNPSTLLKEKKCSDSLPTGVRFSKRSVIVCFP
ncbi:hypothetical protein SporoP37_00945 [Sporosarcina sp. P37]|nr:MULTISPECIES: hypothetical protein [unclassified Sporosarcina]ARD46873.1 hypothetical protein SporoP33_00545 [Sporosarcina sp. P33]ARK23398.1 hypothetical protein SporoP37_00945 [Sporosarcina sp. P37]PID19654.1 hypothetical protein CSV62_03905 [Sporosarcina sp. P35]